MVTKLEKTLKRELVIKDVTYVVTISPEGVKVTVKGRRNGKELTWHDLVAGEPSLAGAAGASSTEEG